MSQFLDLQTVRRDINIVCFKKLLIQNMISMRKDSKYREQVINEEEINLSYQIPSFKNYGHCVDKFVISWQLM